MSGCLIPVDSLPVQSCDTPLLLGSWMRWATFMEDKMGKYVLAWILGVPAFVLVLIYMFAH